MSRSRSTPSDDAAGRSCVRFAVTDTGPGIPAHLLSAIFEPFTKVSTNPADTPHGAGVGLAVAKRLVESDRRQHRGGQRTRHGREVLDHDPGDAKRPPSPNPTTSRARRRLSRSQLLVLARDPAMRAAIDRMLTPFGNRITFAENLGQASTISARNAFDAILSTASHVDSLSATPGHRTPILGARRVGRTSADRRRVRCCAGPRAPMRSMRRLQQSLGEQSAKAKGRTEDRARRDRARRESDRGTGEIARPQNPARYSAVLHADRRSRSRNRSRPPPSAATGRRPAAWRRTSRARPAVSGSPG